MRRLQVILSTLMLAFLLGSGSAAQAVDSVQCLVSMNETVDISSDRNDSAPEKGVQKAIHQHGACHGHCLAVMPDASQQEPAADQIMPIVADHISFDAGADPGRVNRPPIA